MIKNNPERIVEINEAMKSPMDTAFRWWASGLWVSFGTGLAGGASGKRDEST
jgi:hypothetical protein